jgi:hypothetical protein
MLRSTVASVTLAVLASLATGCGDASDVHPLPIGRTELPVINGTVDNSHPAVVAIVGGNAACSATIIQVDANNGIGHALTAAHCDGMQYVLQGVDYNNPDATYPIIDHLDHPNYNQQVYDFQMVRFNGASGQTPVIPAMTPQDDNLAPGSQIRHVGYGKSGPPPGQNNSVRHQFVSSVSQLDTLMVYYDYNGGGTCFGDSGGPQLTTQNERVASVSSFVFGNNCDQGGGSGRVSAVYDTFVVPYINNAPIGPQSCDGCWQWATTGQGACVGQVEACFNDNDCSTLVDCFNACSTQTCINNCAAAHPSGYAIFEQIGNCVCTTACSSECGSEPFCQGGTSSSAAVSVSASATNGAGGGAGVGGSGPGPGVGGAGAGVAGDDDWRAGNLKNQTFESTSSCAVGAAGSGAPAWIAMAAAFAACARRRRGRASSGESRST